MTFKVVLVTETGVREYDPEMPVMKFIVRKDGIIIVGDVSVVGVCHRRLAETYARFTGEDVATRDDLIGAGIVKRMGGLVRDGVEGWGSEGFKVWTPETIRPAILEALGGVLKE